MANYCTICKSEMGRFDRGETLFGISGICSKCTDEIQVICKHGRANQADLYKKAKSSFRGKHMSPHIKSLFEQMDAMYNLEDAEEKEREKAEERERFQKHRTWLQSIRDMPVSTVDICQPYDVIGPIIVNTTNKGIFSSAYSKLLEKYSTSPMNTLLKMPSTSSEVSGEFGTFLLSLFDTSLAFEGAIGQGSFDMAYYICVAELKLRCAEMGGDAIVGMKMDFDLDTTNWGGFYIQMHGTAVKLKDN